MNKNTLTMAFDLGGLLAALYFQVLLLGANEV